MTIIYMIAPNSLAEQQRKRGQKGIPTSGSDVPAGLFRSGVLNVRDRRNYRPRCRVPLYRKGKGAWKDL